MLTRVLLCGGAKAVSRQKRIGRRVELERLKPYTGTHNGGYTECNKWYFEHRSQDGVVYRFPGFSDRTATEELGPQGRANYLAALGGSRARPDAC